jgi:DNA-binding response OmpR family regulator
VFTSIFPAEREALDLEPAAYFIKPFALQELEAALSAALASV